MATTKKNTTQLVVSKLGKKGKTAQTIATQLEANPLTVGTILSGLVKSGEAVIVGKMAVNGTGRPANLYAKA